LGNGEVEGFGGQQEEDTGEGIALARSCFDGDDQTFPAVDFNIGISYKCEALESRDCYFRDSEGP